MGRGAARVAAVVRGARPPVDDQARRELGLHRLPFTIIIDLACLAGSIVDTS